MFFVMLAVSAVFGLAMLLRPWPLFPAVDESAPEHNQAGERNVAREFVKWVERQAIARELNVRGVARPVPIECPKCHRASNYFVYPDELCERCWRATLRVDRVPAKNSRP